MSLDKVLAQAIVGMSTKQSDVFQDGPLPLNKCDVSELEDILPLL